MADETAAQSGGEDTFVVTAPEDTKGALSALEGARLIRRARDEAQGITPTETEPQAAETDADPPQEAHGETEDAPEPAPELPPIEPPKSWSKEERERFNALPRETQEYLTEREQARDRELRRTQNEAAEQRRVLMAQRAQAEQARIQYESALPQLLAAQQAQLLGEFSDVKTFADAEKLANEDPFRFQKFQLAMAKLSAVKQEAALSQQRQAQSLAATFAQYSQTEDSKFSEAVPEMNDPVKARETQAKATKLMHNHGFTQQELQAAWNGLTGFSLRDARVQTLLHKAMLYDNAQATIKQAQKAPVPPVQKPGMARPAGAANIDNIRNIQKQLSTATGLKAVRLGKELMQAQRRGPR